MKKAHRPLFQVMCLSREAKLFIPFINSVYENFNKKQLNNNLEQDNQKDKKNNKQ